GRKESGPCEFQEARRKTDHDVWLGGLDSAADGGRELLRAGTGQERSKYSRVLPPFHGSWHGALRRRQRSGSPRPHDGNDQLGGKGQGSRLNGSEPRRE